MKNIERFQIISGTAGEIETQVGEALASHPNMQILNVCACVRRRAPDQVFIGVDPAAPAAGTSAAPKPVAIDISDAAKTLAEQHGIDLTKVTGTGSKGTIKVSDVQAAIDAKATAGESTEGTETPTETPQAATTIEAIEYEEEVIITYSLAIVG